MIEVTVASLTLDKHKSPVVILREKDGERVLPIWIGPAEANAIAMELAGVKFSRPLTHDLMRRVIIGLGARLNQVKITNVQDSTYYAELDIRRDDHVVQVDARPSDSIAVALRLQAPIFTEEELLTVPGELLEPEGQPSEDPEELDPNALRDYLEGMDPEDFGKFKR